MTESGDNPQTLLNSPLTGPPFWRLVLSQYRACYLTSPQRTLRTIKPAWNTLLFGLVFAFVGIWIEDVFPGVGPSRNWGFSMRIGPFLIIAIGYLVVEPATVPLYPTEHSPIRFSLRTLLGVITFACVLFAVVVGVYRFAAATDHRRENVTQAMQDCGDVFHIVFAPLSANVRALGISSADDDDVRAIVALPENHKLVQLHLHQPGITDDALDDLKALPYLRQLNVWGATLSDESVERFEQATDCTVSR